MDKRDSRQSRYSGSRSGNFKSWRPKIMSCSPSLLPSRGNILELSFSPESLLIKSQRKEKRDRHVLPNEKCSTDSVEGDSAFRSVMQMPGCKMPAMPGTDLNTHLILTPINVALFPSPGRCKVTQCKAVAYKTQVIRNEIKFCWSFFMMLSVAKW